MSRSARLLFIAVYSLVGIGIVMTYSASAIYAEHVYDNPQFFLTRQIIYVLLGTVFLFAFAALPVSFWKGNARPFILLSILLLALLFVPGLGHTAGGARRWMRVGIISFQPVELTKVAVCLYLSDYLARKARLIKKGGLKVFLPPAFLVGIICALTLMQPDLGSCVFIFLITAILFFIAGIRWRYLLTASLIFLPIFYFLVMKVPYRLSRIVAYLNPWQDPQGSGFQMIQSFLAFGLGGIKGVGLGQSTQKLFYLPSGYNDFIFAIIGEEMGLVGVLAVVVLYGVIFFCGISVAGNTTETFDKLLVLSITLFLVLQAIINMMVTIGLIPTKGLPLPFISYGGTSMVVNLMSVGLLMGVDIHRHAKKS